MLPALVPETISGFFAPGQRLDDHVNFAFQIAAQSVHRRGGFIQRMGNRKAQTRLIFGPARDRSTRRYRQDGCRQYW
ncbi:Uncharacterised protein [Raoultella ornithinolytica]|nr:Uncharacterised protein [Raoultella ornithinolytica]